MCTNREVWNMSYRLINYMSYGRNLQSESMINLNFNFKLQFTGMPNL